jgi:phosphatidylglycerophosphatase A
MPTPRRATDPLAVGIGTFALTGFFPVAPATFASAVVTPLLALAYHARPGAAFQAGLCVAILWVGVWASGRLEQLYGKDPSAAVIDEVLGMAMTLFAVPSRLSTWYSASFLFRIFDVVKLWPGRRLERLPVAGAS